MSRARSDEDRRARREAFLDAAIDVVRRDGPRASMEAMARQAGVTKPILYRVFGDRNGLLQALGDRFNDELRTVLARSLARAGDDHPRTLLRSTIDAYLTLVERDPEVYRFLTARLGGDAAGTVASMADDVARQVAAVMSDELRATGADTGPAEPWAYAIVGMVHLAGDWWMRRRSISRTALVDHLVSLAWDGLGSVGPLEQSPG